MEHTGLDGFLSPKYFPKRPLFKRMGKIGDQVVRMLKSDR